MIVFTHGKEEEFATITIHCDLESEQIADELVAALEAYGWDVGDVRPSKREGCTHDFYLLKALTRLRNPAQHTGDHRCVTSAKLTP